MNEFFLVLHLLVLEHLRERLISSKCSADSIRAARVCSNRGHFLLPLDVIIFIFFYINLCYLCCSRCIYLSKIRSPLKCFLSEDSGQLVYSEKNISKMGFPCRRLQILNFSVGHQNKLKKISVNFKFLAQSLFHGSLKIEIIN